MRVQGACVPGSAVKYHVPRTGSGEPLRPWGTRTKGQKISEYGEGNDRQTTLNVFENAAAILLFSVQDYIFFYNQRTWQRHTSSNHRTEKNSIKQFTKRIFEDALTWAQGLLLSHIL